MARNMITGIETQKMQEYTQEQIDRAEHMGIAIPADVKEQIFEYANLVGEEEKVRTLVRNLADAVNRSDEDRVEELLDDAQMDIQDLPDPTIGRLELRDYGYTAEDMVPLRKAAALDYHRMGSKIYCLGSDGSKGEYASKEMIQAHEGLFGMESQMWERIRDQDLDYADEDFGAFQEPMNVIGQEEALKLYDAGADIYLITNFSSPIYVTERMEIERGPEHYQMSTEELERFRNLEWEMQKYPQIQSLKEANLLLGTRRTFGIYQIRDGLPGENYAFMNMSFIESHGMQIKKEDYELVYVGELFGNMSLDDIFERFNIDRPEDFRGHSLSVSDIVVLNEGGKVTAHFVDSISFEQLDSFLNLEEQVLSELAYEVGERYFAIQRTEGGYDYSFYDEDFRLMDGGVYENGEISIEEAAEELLEDEGWTGERIRGDYDQLMEKVEEMDEVVMAEIQKSQGEYKPLAKVEELEEANYNMIDNVLNNMPPKKEPYLLEAIIALPNDIFYNTGREAVDGRYGKDANRVLRAIDSAEKDCGIRLLEADPKAEGVIGSRVLPKGWVARKPSDIYWNGIRTFGIFCDYGLSIPEYVSLAVKLKEQKSVSRLGNRNDDAEENDKDDSDAGDIGNIRFWNLPIYHDDWRDNLTIELTQEEAFYLDKQIQKSTKGSLLEYVLKNRIDLNEYDDFASLTAELSEKVGEKLAYMMKLACDFNNLVYMARVRYNVMLSEDENTYANDEWSRLLPDIRHNATVDLDAVFGEFQLINPRAKSFLCGIQAAFITLDIDMADELIRKRERSLKGAARAKLSRTKEFDHSKWVGGGMLDYRFSNARRIVNDIYAGEVSADV